ncbi:hypothetical protein AX17_000054 [Amanita inopinata Kibby_2008]|nr:hypothetical protein AX17_000054 [Amanita inopinata Kibby_2008]
MVTLSLAGSTTWSTELILLGTGTSSSLPNVDCLTASLADKSPCKTCLSTLSPQGKKNIRRNTSAALRMKATDGRSVTIVIDVGKNFQAAALEWFPKYGLRRIDGLLITHAHADAVNGLDDLRGWTLRGAIQPYIDVYVSQETYVEVQRSFPYLVSKEFASGGGDASHSCTFGTEHDRLMKISRYPNSVGTSYMTESRSKSAKLESSSPHLQVGHLSPVPMKHQLRMDTVQHGRVFSVAPPLGCTPTPSDTKPSTPTPHVDALPTEASGGVKRLEMPEASFQPYMCFGFKVQQQIAYISDVSFIPEDVWPLLQSLSVLVLDCLRLWPHTSHLGLEDAVKIARRIGASRTYLTGFSHEVSHEEYVTIGEMVGGQAKDRAELTEMEKIGAEMVGGGKQIWLRPGHDGLRVLIGNGGSLANRVEQIDGRQFRVEWSFVAVRNSVKPHLTACSPTGPGSLAMKFFTQSFLYDDSWSIVSLAFFLRYPNPYAAHVVSCDVISRTQTPTGSLVTTRLILKKGSLPRWAPKGIVSRTESWIIEESEVDPMGKTVRCTTKNLDHVKVMQVEESILFHQTPDGKTLQTTEARIRSGFGWGLTKRIESHGLKRFKANVQRSREGVSLIVELLRQSRLQPMTLGGGASSLPERMSASHSDDGRTVSKVNVWSRLKSWLQPPST